MSWELTVVSFFRNTAPYLKEWIEYHHMVGVDHFLLYNDASTDNWEELLKPYIDSGLVEVFYWPKNGPLWQKTQRAAFRDGLTRTKGVSTWVALIDQDEFLFPKRDKTVTKCLRKYYSECQAVYINWRNFGTSHKILHEGEPMLTRLISCSMKLHPRNSVGKSIVRPEAVQLMNVYYTHHIPLIPGAIYLDGDGERSLISRGLDWETSGKPHTKYLQINHYAFRDEKYFRETRLPRDSNPKLLLSLYEEYNLVNDHSIIKFIKKYHPAKFKKIWTGLAGEKK
jgi:hypothetical protein